MRRLGGGAGSVLVNDEADRQLALDQPGLEERDREVIPQLDEALGAAWVIAPLDEFDAACLLAGLVQPAVEAQLLQQGVGSRLRTFVILPDAPPGLIAQGLIDILRQEARLPARPGEILWRVEAVA